MFNMVTNTFINSHLLHALLNIFQWNIEHARYVEWGDGIHAAQLLFHTNQVFDVLLEVSETVGKGCLGWILKVYPILSFLELIHTSESWDWALWSL